MLLNSHTSWIHQNLVLMEHDMMLYANEWQETMCLPVSSVHVYAPLSPQTSLKEHKFKNKIKNFRTVTANFYPWGPSECSPLDNCTVHTPRKMALLISTRAVPRGIPLKISFEKEFYIVFKMLV